MANNRKKAEAVAASVLATIPPVWDRIRTNLRAAGTGKLGISLEQFHALRHIKRGYSTVGALADARQISRSAASQAVDALVSKGLVVRTRSDEDMRFVTLALTVRASRVLDENIAETRAWMADRMASLPSERLDAIAFAMATLSDAFAAPEEDRRG